MELMAFQIWATLGNTRPPAIQRVESELWRALFDISTKDYPDTFSRLSDALEAIEAGFDYYPLSDADLLFFVTDADNKAVQPEELGAATALLNIKGYPRDEQHIARSLRDIIRTRQILALDQGYSDNNPSPPSTPIDPHETPESELPPKARRVNQHTRAYLEKKQLKTQEAPTYNTFPHDCSPSKRRHTYSQEDEIVDVQHDTVCFLLIGHQYPNPNYCIQAEPRRPTLISPTGALVSVGIT